ncbi:MAG: hypothetical protein ACREKL_11180 [Chthoniobacterales bacterium]
MKPFRFNRLVERHYATLYSIAASLTSGPVAALLLTQQALRRAQQHLSENEGIACDRDALEKVFLLEVAGLARG